MRESRTFGSVEGVLGNQDSYSDFVELQATLSRKEERHRPGHRGNVGQRPEPADRRGSGGGSDRLAGASGAPRRCEPVGHRQWRPEQSQNRVMHKGNDWEKRLPVPFLAH